MKLLFDHNVSPRLVQRLADLAPDSIHVAVVGLEGLILIPASNDEP
jgi:predicted nuclease of predicted toxin-antitoxin system